MVEICKESPNDYSINHIDYIKSLSFFQELYIEWLVESSTFYIIKLANEIIGHAFLTKKKQLVEFYIVKQYLNFKEEIFNDVLIKLRCKSALVKSFDYLFLACSNKFVKKVRAIGYLFREYSNVSSYELNSEIHTRQADQNDYSMLIHQKGELYESKKELYNMLHNKQITLYYINKNLIGCGFKLKIHADFNYYDIGMWVNPEYRKQGYAKQIIGHLKTSCLHEENIPICGCAITNRASKKTLEANGFQTVHNLLEYKF